MRVSLLAATIVALGVVAAARPVSAQKGSSVAVGVVASIYRATDANVDIPVGIGLIGRLRRTNGIGFTVGLDWYKANVQTDIGADRTFLGRVSLRPIMAGAGWTRQYSRFALNASLVAGWSFNSLRATSQAEAAYAKLGQPGARIDVSNSFVFRPDFSLWYELNNRFGLLASLSYMASWPTVTTTTPAGVRHDRINLGAPMLTLGVSYGVF